MLVWLLLASLCVATNWTVIYSSEDIVATSCSPSRSCRLYDYLVVSGVQRDHIIMMSPSLHWNTQIDCKRKKKRLSREKNNSPLNVPYGDVCWSHLDYVGDYVDFPFLINVLNGNSDAVSTISNITNPKVVVSDKTSNIFVYYESNQKSTILSQLEENGVKLMSRKNIKFKKMLWLTDTSQTIHSFFEKSVLDYGCLIINLHQLQNTYGYVAYSPDDEKSQMRVFTGMWDHSWVDMLLMMNGYTIEKMVMAATAGLIQINSTETVGYWGDERLFDLPVKSLFHSNFPAIECGRYTISIVPKSGLQNQIGTVIVMNRRKRNQLEKDYFRPFHEIVKQRRKQWNNVFLSSSLQEDPSVIASEEMCVRHMVLSYYHSCKYSYPFDDELMQLLHSLCRFRKTSGVYSLSNTMFCDNQMPSVIEVLN